MMKDVFRRNWFEVSFILFVAALCLWHGRSWVFKGNSVSSDTVLTASVIVYGAIILITEYCLRRQGVGYERFFIALAAMLAGIWLEQLCYTNGYGVLPASQILGGLVTLNGNTTNATYPLLWNIIMMCLPFVGYRYMKINKTLIAVGGLGFLFYGLWIMSGYPQFFSSAALWFPSTPIYLHIVAKNPASIAFYGYLFNTLFKLIALIPALLFNKKPKKLKPKLRHIPENL